ncbi:U11/U12 small nuclear ribonucleoprotein 31 kDa protein-like [Chenopodium quinoa]|uniref:U11/U12 small nuclear ribonucleoprotein 31 kDa protein-like n=1 Tax=Chenopodium quinoa TaxID=63459 RepID=UPI000B77E2ED|nr:U11/U12 small nuclear ribonucleoprotein 31 kDa protein-like [Chenopodium quinoa]XP_021716207.1 U11/U12 small nuclear ribonucleoprotein 31 kDa protein-like [Chenopodium quinoa]
MADSDEDDTFYYRYSTPTAAHSTASASTTTKHSSSSGSGGLAPSKSTVYVSNIDYNLTNSDLFTIFSTFGKVARVTILKDQATRRSRGVAFVLFVSRDDAVSAARQMNEKILNGRTLRASIASDNGRAAEFIRRRVYKDKSRCYECGEEGHLSYECPKNQLGPRERPVPKKGRREKEQRRKEDDEVEEREGDEEEVAFEEDNWASVVDSDADQRLLMGHDEQQRLAKGKKVKKASYFSDESGEED